MRAGRLEPPVVVDVQKVTFDPKRYLYPIPYNEVNKNGNMKQNLGW